MLREGGEAEEISETVKKWKENNELQLPKFDPKRVEELKDSIKYPDKGSFDPNRDNTMF
ncbi:hypothetical protein SOM12_19080 [Flavobacterium sp. CFBP9031]|uniref:hypothetical protein n=1 Tax=unclassified Flavobacterium TaxID=196869 RepID=UPI0015552D6A|nr:MULTISPECIES: hypothetical protein [unclassified Flavobacterium]MDY0989543.1 hypothetical protein [Flavobacterium sp. CFBP9031]